MMFMLQYHSQGEKLVMGSAAIQAYRLLHSVLAVSAGFQTSQILEIHLCVIFEKLFHLLVGLKGGYSA